MKTTITSENALSIPFFDASYKIIDEKGVEQKVGKAGEPEIIRNSILQKMFEPEELESLTIVKTGDKNPDPKDLVKRQFEDGIERRIMFSSGSSNYFGNDELANKIRQLFDTERDSACRYGSLLVSNCMEGSEEIGDLRVKIVDFKDPEYAEFKTGDCHGKISPALAKEIGGTSDRALQFRFAWLTSWNKENETDAPETSFLAKGTLLPDSTLTDDEGYDLILDRSSIKGIKKELINELIECGDYVFPKVILGNRENSEVGQVKNSWQLFGIWCSEEAQRLDLVPETRKQAELLANLQKDPLKLAKHLIEKYDKKKEFSEANENATLTDSDPLNELSEEKTEKQEMRNISLLRSDKLGLLLTHPAIKEFLENSVAKEWRELAINSGVKLSSGMALPCTDLPPGTICANHLPDGEEIIVTRYPVLNKDNIRKYTNDKTNYPELTKYKGVVWLNPQDFEQYHQGDFDGDKAVVKRAKEIPNIAKEMLAAGEQPEYIEVVQAQKVPYTDVRDEKTGKKKYTQLGQIAVASSQNKVGLVATYIGRIASAVPNEGEDVNTFEKKQKKLIIGLSIMEQYEVDYQKNSLRGEDAKEIKRETGIDAKNLLKEAKTFSEEHPSPLFDFKKDDRLFKTFPMPADGLNAINVVAREAVNPYWEETHLQSRPRHEFLHLMPKPEGDLEWEETEMKWAKDLNKRFKEDVSTISQRTKGDKDSFIAAIGNLYEGYRGEVQEICGNDPEKRERYATALFHVTHTNPVITKDRQRCEEIAKDLKVGFGVQPYYHLLHEAMPRETYVLQVPFQKVQIDKEELVIDKSIKGSLDKANIEYKPEGKNLVISDSDTIKKVKKSLDNHNIDYEIRSKTIDLPNKFKEELDKIGIKYEAVAHENLPLVEFAFQIKPDEDVPKEVEKYIKSLESSYSENENFIDAQKLTITDYKTKENRKVMIVPPTKCSWIETPEESGKNKLFYNLFADEMCKVLKTYQVEKIDLIGVKHPNNDFNNEDFTTKKWANQKTFKIGAIDLDKTDPDYIKYQGAPIIQIDGKNLGTFSSNSAKLPIGTTFEATCVPDISNGGCLTLKVTDGSIKLPEPEVVLPKEQITIESTQTIKQNEDQKEPKLPTEKPPEYYEQLLLNIVSKKVAAENSQSKENQVFTMGNWMVNINHASILTVRDKGGFPVYVGNIHTKETILEMDEGEAQELAQIIKEAKQIKNQKAQQQNPVKTIQFKNQEPTIEL